MHQEGEEKQSYGTRAAETRTQAAECQPRARNSAHGTRAQSTVSPWGCWGASWRRWREGTASRVRGTRPHWDSAHQGHREPQAVSEQDSGPFGEMAEAKDAQGTGENTQGQSKATASGTEKKVTRRCGGRGPGGCTGWRSKLWGEGARCTVVTAPFWPPRTGHLRGTDAARYSCG